MQCAKQISLSLLYSCLVHVHMGDYPSSNRINNTYECNSEIWAKSHYNPHQLASKVSTETPRGGLIIAPFFSKQEKSFFLKRSDLNEHLWDGIAWPG